MYFNANIGDNHKVLVEAQLESAFNKSDGEDIWVREEAVINSIRIAAEIGAVAAKFLDEGFKDSQSSAEFSFGIKMTSDGAVAVAMSPEGGQFKITVKQRLSQTQGSGRGARPDGSGGSPSYGFRNDEEAESEGDKIADELMGRIGHRLFGDDD